MLRVVGGTVRGRRLVAPAGERTRPTTDRVREAIFNALWSLGAVEGARVLDLFAGSGALGVEALSRGAARATFVDRDPTARRVIRQNLAACGFEDRAEVVATTVERFLGAGARAPGPDGGPAARSDDYDLAFCDPPYDFDGWEALLRTRPAGLLVAESARPVTPPPGWRLTREHTYGRTWVGFLSLTDPGGS